MKEKLRAALKAKGLNEGLADFITVTTEEEITNVINGLGGGNATNELTPEEILNSKTFNDFLTAEGGFDKALAANKALQSAHDKKVAQGIATFKTKILGEDTPPANPSTKPADTNDAPPWAAALFAKVAELEKGKEKDTKLDSAKGLMEKAKLPEKYKSKWLSRLQLESDESIETQIKSLEEEYKDLHVGIVGEEAYQFQEGEQKTNSKKMSQADADALTALAKKL